MSGFYRDYADPDAVRMRIQASADHSPGAFLMPLDADERAGVAVPAHRLAEFVTTMYEAAGQPVPDLPQIFEPAEVDAMASALHYALHGTNGTGYEHVARSLLAHGWRKVAGQAEAAAELMSAGGSQ